MNFTDEPPYLFSPRKVRTLVIYAYATWIYRFFLFLAIAVLVYYLFFKALGILLFLLEIYLLILLPILAEIKYCYARRDNVVLNKKLISLGVVSALGFILLFIPFARQVSAPAIIQHTNFIRIYAPYAAQADKIYVKSGDMVANHAKLVHLKSPEITHLMTDLQNDIKILQRRLEIHHLLSSIAGYQQVDREDLRTKQNAYQALQEKQNKLSLYAPFAGEVVTFNHKIVEGRWLPKDIFILELVAKPDQIIEAYVPEY